MTGRMGEGTKGRRDEGTTGQLHLSLREACMNPK